ncbi:MAG: hypothetical protein KJ967_04740 [Elusimicrobia bacterium]|nr:hypothetical protein [Elusimicrobiota bacterium]
MKHQLKTGLGFGSTSGIITTLGLMVGLHSGTHSRSVVISGILMIAIADSFSDAMGIHVSEESENTHTEKELWEATIYTFLSKLITPLLFIVPLLLFELSTAIIVSVIMGLSLLGFFSIYIAREQKKKIWRVVFEHLAVALIVVAITHYVGDWLSNKFV